MLRFDLDIPKEDRRPRHRCQRIPLSHTRGANLRVKPAPFIEPLFSPSAHHAGAHTLLLCLVKAPLDQRASVALALVIRMHGERLKVPRLRAGTRPNVVEVWVGALDDVLVRSLGGAIRPDACGDAGEERGERLGEVFCRGTVSRVFLLFVVKSGLLP